MFFGVEVSQWLGRWRVWKAFHLQSPVLLLGRIGIFWWGFGWTYRQLVPLHLFLADLPDCFFFPDLIDHWKKWRIQSHPRNKGGHGNVSFGVWRESTFLLQYYFFFFPRFYDHFVLLKFRQGPSLPGFLREHLQWFRRLKKNLSFLTCNFTRVDWVASSAVWYGCVQSSLGPHFHQKAIDSSRFWKEILRTSSYSTCSST